MFDSAKIACEEMLARYGFDLVKNMQSERWGFYGAIKIINYVTSNQKSRAANSMLRQRKQITLYYVVSTNDYLEFRGVSKTFLKPF